MSMSLMTTRRFAPLFWCQFFAAFGDNFLKTALVFVILFEVSGSNAGALITLAGATLIAPFFFLSGLGGELADRYDKAFVAQRIKLVEIGAAVIAVAGFAFHSLILLFGAIVAGVAANGNSNPIHFAWLMVLSALASWLSSLLIPRSGEGAPGLAINHNILVSTVSLIKQ